MSSSSLAMPARDRLTIAIRLAPNDASPALTAAAAPPAPSTVITGGFRRRADLREIDPLPLELLRDHLPTSRIRFGFFELSPEHAEAIWDLVPPP